MNAVVAQPAAVARHQFAARSTRRNAGKAASAAPALGRRSVAVRAAANTEVRTHHIHTIRIERVDAALTAWESGALATQDLPWSEWVYQERYRFLSNLADDTNTDRMADLDAVWSIGATGNNEILFAWMEQAVRSGYQPAYGRLEMFLIEVGRRKFLTPLYRAMKETGQMDMALSIYKQARPGYHAVATSTMDELLAWN